jgi:hypothetical protein
MRAFILLVLGGVSAAAVSLGQGQEASQTPQAPQKKVQQVQAEDGGVSERLESIVIPPKPQAPFTLTLETEWVKTLSDGGTITFVNKRRIARDAKGRIYQERWALVPKDGKAESVMTAIQITDPSAHTLYNCFPLSKTKTCELLTYTASSSTDYKVVSAPAGALPDDRGSAIHADLGKQFIAGVETAGTRDATIYNPGVFGNDRKVTVEREFWYSPELGVNLLSIRSDPRFGKQTFTVTTVTLAEPDLSLFELPAGFTVVDRRQSVPPEGN